MSQLTPVEPGFRIPIPPEWAGQLGMQSQVTLERLGDGILIRACPSSPPPSTSWDEVFADKLVVNSGPGCDNEEVTGDDLLF